MRIVGLFRVSTEKQESEGASLDAQVRRFRSLAASRRWTIAEEFRGQESAAGQGKDREVLQRATAFLRDGGADAVWVYEQSRLTRGDQLECALLLREIQERDLVVFVNDKERDVASIEGEMFFTIQGAVDRAESRRIKERMKFGRREKAMGGKRTGGKAPYGYRNPPKGDPLRGVLQIVPDEAEVVRRIFREIAAGVSIRKLCRIFAAEGLPAPRSRAWGKSTIRRVLDNLAYLGTAFYGVWTPIRGGSSRRLDLTHPDAILQEGAHEPIIDRETWNAARATVKGNSNGRPGMLSGLLTLNGRRTTIDAADHRSYYKPAEGRGPWVPVDEVNRIAWRAFHRMMQEPSVLADLVQSEPAQQSAGAAGSLAQLEAQLSKLTARHERLTEMRADGELTRAEFAQRSEDARRAIKQAEAEIVRARRRLASSEGGTVDRTLEAVRATLAGGIALSIEARRVLISAVASRVVVAAEERGPQPRGKGGRFAPSKGSKWLVSKVTFALNPAMVEGTIDFEGSQRQIRYGIQVVGNGRLIAPRRVRLEDGNP